MMQGAAAKHRLRQVVAVCVVLGMGSLSMSILRPMLPLYLADIQLDPAMIGLVVSVSMIGMVIGETFSGMVADRFGLRLPFIIGTVVCGLIAAAFVVSRALPWIFGVGFMLGLTRAAIFGPGRGYLADAAPLGKKATFMALPSAIFALSRGVGALPGGFIADSLGYDWVFYVAGAVAVAGTAAALLSPKRSMGAIPREGPTDGPGWRTFLGTFVLQGVIAVFTFLNMGVLLSFAPLLGTEVVHISATEVGFVFTANGIATMLFTVPMGIAGDRFGRRTAMVVGLLVCGGAMVGFGLARSFGWLMAMGIVHAFGMAVFAPSALALLSENVPRGRQATAMGIYGGTFENSGLVAGSAIGGFVWKWSGAAATFYAGAAAAGVGAILCLFLSPALARAKKPAAYRA
jgi:MFS family permease